MPIAANIPLTTALGKKAAITPARKNPNKSCRQPASITASEKTAKPPRDSIPLETMTLKPAAGPEILSTEPLSAPITIPPVIPAIKPDDKGAPEARAIPKHNGNATKNTTRPADKSPIS